jgi:hypothetical protein
MNVPPATEDDDDEDDAGEESGDIDDEDEADDSDDAETVDDEAFTNDEANAVCIEVAPCRPDPAGDDDVEEDNAVGVGCEEDTCSEVNANRSDQSSCLSTRARRRSSEGAPTTCVAVHSSCSCCSCRMEDEFAGKEDEENNEDDEDAGDDGVASK